MHFSNHKMHIKWQKVRVKGHEMQLNGIAEPKNVLWVLDSGKKCG